MGATTLFCRYQCISVKNTEVHNGTLNVITAIKLSDTDNLHSHDNSIILIVIFLLRIYTVQKPGNALITQFSDIIERIKSQPSAQRSTQNRNVGYTYFYSPNLMISASITMLKYYTISEICSLVQKLTYICFGHIRLMVEDTLG